MKKKISDAPKTRLRHQAEAELSKQKKTAPATDADTQRLIHELEVHQIELEMQNEELVRSHAETEAALHLYEFAPISLFTLAHDGGICQVNQAGANLLGADAEREKLIKRRFGLFVSPKFRPAFAAFLDKVFLEGAEKETCEVEFLKDKIESLWAHIEAVRDHSREQGEICHAVVSDITERKQAEEALHESKERFKGAFEHSPIGMALISPEGKWLQVNSEVCSIVGYSEDELLTKTFQDITHPDDMEIDLGYVRQMLAGEIDTYKMEKRYFHKEGHTIWVLLSVALVKDNAGSPLYFISQIEDITERKRAEEALVVSEEKWRSLVKAIPDYVSLHDSEGRFLFLNHYAEGFSEKDVIGNSLFQYLAPKSLETFKKSLENCKSTGTLQKFEHTAMGDHGVMHEYEDYIVPIIEKNGSATTLLVSRDITERKRAEDALKSANEQLNLRIIEVENLQSELREQALHEPLTGLYNRRYLNETLSREITRAERENDPLSVIMSDIDHFKMINDTYGHSVGDQFLVEIASLMKNHARSSDIVCRYGGEEFLLVLPSTTLDAAEKRAEELRQKCAEIVIQHEGKDLKVTMSFGVATYPDHGKESEEIIIKADKALYRAKAQGRNCTVMFE